MPLKPKDSNSSSEKRTVTFDDLSFFNGILNDKYILVVGSGIILNKKKYPETKGDINAFLLNVLNEGRKEEDIFNSISDAVSAADSRYVSHCIPS